jgi:hypothetical protein
MERGGIVYSYGCSVRREEETPSGEEHYEYNSKGHCATLTPTTPFPSLVMVVLCVWRRTHGLDNRQLCLDRQVFATPQDSSPCLPCAQGDHQGCLTGTMTTPTPCPGGPAHKDSTLQVFRPSLRPVCLAWAHLCGSNRVEGVLLQIISKFMSRLAVC